MSLDLSPDETVAVFVAAVVTLLACVVGMGVFLVRIPPDHFVKPAQPPRSSRDWALKIGKNVLGVLFVVVGALMLPLPGPGSLVLVVGLTLVDFPGRSRLVKAIVSRPFFARPVNWLRRKFGRPPLQSKAPRTAGSLKVA